MNTDKYKIKKSSGDIETHHVFLDTFAHSKEEELGISEKKFEVPLNKAMIYFLFALFFLSTMVLFGKAFYLQIIDGRQLNILNNNNKGSIDLQTPERGIIYDSDGNKLVLNAPDYDFVCDEKNFSPSTPASLQEIQQMSDALGKSAGDIATALATPNESKALVYEDIPQEILLVLETKMSDFPDCQIQQNTTRNYVLGPIFSQVLGYTGKPSQQDLASNNNYTITDNVGKTGLEEYYQQYLKGTPGSVQSSKTATGKDKGQENVSDGVPGDNLVLNIDSHLQTEVYNALQAGIKKIGAAKGAAVVMDPNTGAVLALVSYPSYDDNLFSGGISQTDYSSLINDPNQPLFDRAISGQYPTGSVIKPFMASAALQENIISPDTEINDPGYILVKSQYDPSITYRFNGIEAHGLVDVRKALAVSSNIYFYTVGGGYGSQQGLGPARIKKYLDLFGWEQKTGIDLPGEYQGFVPSPAWKESVIKLPWTIGDTYNLSIGQSYLQVTPLQVAAAYCAIANGGTLYQPQIVNKIISGPFDSDFASSSGNSPAIVKQFTPEIIRQGFIDPANLEIVREGMRDGVTEPYGLETTFNNLPVAVAAKTGTVQFGKVGYFNTWSSVFAPYDKPDLEITVTIENVKGLGEATLPVTKDILNWYYSKTGPGAADLAAAAAAKSATTSNQ